ncbi:MAG: DHHW family protein [Eubacteriales bacterium]|nr:DHHW family protein [Eubacteriales bacterium]
MNSKQKQTIIFSFLFVLFLGFISTLLGPKRSLLEDENRKANPFPKFNADSFRSGNLAESFEKYYADQFPLRKQFMALDRSIKTLLNPLAAGDSNQVQVFHQERDLGRGENLKDIEKAKDASTPTSTAASTAAPTTTHPKDTTAPLNAPLPTVAVNDVQNVGSVVLVGDRAMEVFYFDKGMNTNYALRLNALADLLENTNVYCIPAPTSSAFYASSDLNSGNNSQADAFETIRQNLNPKVHYVDAYNAIRTQAASPSNPYLYLRTDHHWTQLGAYYAYRAFCDKANFIPLELDEMDSGLIPGDSYGSMLAATNRAQVLLDNPDQVYFWEPRYQVTGIAVDDESIDESNGYSIDLIVKNGDFSNKYLAFTGGDHGYLHYHSSVGNGRSCLLIKESFGNAFVPFLSAHYEDIYVLDPRRVASYSLSQFCAQQSIDDLIVLNYAFGIANPGWQNNFASMIY